MQKRRSNLLHLYITAKAQQESRSWALFTRRYNEFKNSFIDVIIEFNVWICELIVISRKEYEKGINA